MSSLFVALFALVASSLRTRATLQREQPGSSTSAFLDHTFADPKRDSFATRTPCTSMHSSTERGKHCQSLDSDMLANNETSVIDEIGDQRGMDAG